MTASALMPSSLLRQYTDEVRAWLDSDAARQAPKEQWEAVIEAVRFRPEYRGEYCHQGRVSYHEVLD
jgi:hypothetical protein